MMTMIISLAGISPRSVGLGTSVRFRQTTELSVVTLGWWGCSESFWLSKAIVWLTRLAAVLAKVVVVVVNVVVVVAAVVPVVDSSSLETFRIATWP